MRAILGPETIIPTPSPRYQHRLLVTCLEKEGMIVVSSTCRCPDWEGQLFFHATEVQKPEDFKGNAIGYFKEHIGAGDEVEFVVGPGQRNPVGLQVSNLKDYSQCMSDLHQSMFQVMTESFGVLRGGGNGNQGRSFWIGGRVGIGRGKVGIPISNRLELAKRLSTERWQCSRH